MGRADLFLHDPQPTNPSHWRPATVADFSGNGTPSGNGTQTVTYSTANYSGAIAVVNTPQDLAIAAASRDRITIQNLDLTDTLLIGIGEDAQIGRSYEIEPRGWAVIEEGEANQRISIMSAKAALKFVAIARLRS